MCLPQTLFLLSRLPQLPAQAPGQRECRGACKEFSKSGSHAYIDMRTCKQCGKVTKTKKRKQSLTRAPAGTPPQRAGSGRKTSRVKSKLCGVLLDEQPQEECREALDDHSASATSTSWGRRGVLSLVDCRNSPIEVQLGLDQAMSTEW